MQKGDIVLVNATVYTDCELTNKPINQDKDATLVYRPETQQPTSVCSLYKQKQPNPWCGLVIGKSTLGTGFYVHSHGLSINFNPPKLTVTKSHKVWMIEPIDTQEWTTPIPCLEEDLERIE